MSEGLKIALTAVGGVAVFVMGQIIQKWFIDPIQEQRKLVGDIVFSIVEHSNLFHYSESFKTAAKAKFFAVKKEEIHIPAIDEAYETLKERTSIGVEKLRGLSSQIHQSIQIIPCYWLLEKLRIIYNREKLLEVSRNLIEWSHNPKLDTTIRCQNNIAHLLKVTHLIKAAE